MNQTTQTTTTSTTSKARHIYCDGSAPNNQNQCVQGGFGVAVYDHQHNLIGQYSETIKEETTSPRTELKALIYALTCAHDGDIIYTDHEVTCNGYNTGLAKWVASGWRNASKKPVKNKDLWEQVLELKDCSDKVTVVKVAAHACIEGNETADMLARDAAQGKEVDSFHAPVTSSEGADSLTVLTENQKDDKSTDSHISVNVRQLDLNSLYSTRSAEAIAKSNEVMARNIERQRMEADLYGVLACGDNYNQPITTAVVNDKRVVLDGQLRVKVALNFADQHDEDVFHVKAVCLGVMTQVQAFMAAQKMNMEHGLHISADAKRHIQLRQHILMNKPIGSTRELAKVYGLASKTSGAAIQKCLTWIQPYQDTIQKHMNEDNAQAALEFIQDVIKDKLAMSDKAFETLGIPTAKRWAYAIKLMTEGSVLEDDEEVDEKRRMQEAKQAMYHYLETHGTDGFRYAFNSEPELKKAVGITVKRTYDDEAVWNHVTPDSF